MDTGANKNILKPGIMTNTKQTKNTHTTNITGQQIIKRKGKINLLGTKFDEQTFYEMDFHNFFDGIIGSEYLAKSKAIIDFKRNVVQINGEEIPFLKYYPSRQFHNHTVTINTLSDGDWFVPTFQKLTKNIIIEPGLYNSSNNKSTIKIITAKKEKPHKLPQFGVKVNNFETINPIKLKSNEKLNSETLSKLLRTDHLSKIEKEYLFNTILQNSQVLLKPGENLTATTAIKHKILTKDEEPTYTKSYRYPHSYKKDVESQIKELLDNGIITHSTSPYSSPIWVVPKKADASGKKKVRVVIDYRKLNDKTINDKFPIPQIEEILDNLGKSVYFTTLDLKSGFHQIEMDQNHRAKTAFSTSHGHFEFTRMPFGLKNAPATFQRAMNSILREYIGTICYVYLDDIIITGYNLKNHIDNLNKILKRLSDFNLKIQLDKCEFLKTETEFLGHIVTADGIKPNPDKICKILEWKLPTNQKEIKQFLGLTGYYRRFIKDYAKLAKPLSKYLKKDQKVNINDKEYVISFEKLKEIIASDQILSYPNFELPFLLTTDASNFALGGVLSQVQDGKERPIAFGSRTLNKAEENYSTTEKEALAIAWAVEKYRPYLHGNKFTLVTDHKPLVFIKNATKNSKILRWRLNLENFDYDVVYKEGRNNVVADALSRKTDEIVLTNNNETSSISGNSQQDEAMSLQNNTSGSEIQDDNETVHSAQTSDDYYIHFVERPINYYRNQIIFKLARIDTTLSETPFPNFHRTTICKQNFDEETVTSILKHYHNKKQTAILAPESLINTIQTVYRNHFYQSGHFVFTQLQVEDVTNENRQHLLISKEHERAHRGIHEVEAQLKRSYFFPKMLTKIKTFINTCKPCNVHKYERKPYNIKLSPRPVTDKPLDRLHMDIFSIDRNSYLSLVDSFSKHAQLIHIDTKNLVDVKNALAQYFCTFSTPREIITDHETTFRSIQLIEFLDNLGIRLKYASCSESNGQVEKTHSTLIEIINTNKHKFPALESRALVQLAVSLYNTTIHSSTGFTPNEILFNQSDADNLEQIRENTRIINDKVKQNLERARQKIKSQNRDKENPPHITENQEVFIIPNIRKKLDPRAVKTNAKNPTSRTFTTNRNIKRHKRKIKRQKNIT